MNTGIDDSETECEMDEYDHFDLIVHNNGHQTQHLLDLINDALNKIPS